MVYLFHTSIGKLFMGAYESYRAFMKFSIELQITNFITFSFFIGKFCYTNFLN